MNVSILQNNLWIVALIVTWELTWKGLALWRAAKNNQKYWFTALFLINSVGLLPIIYLVMYKK